MFTLALILNTLWFSMGFYTFSINHRVFAKVVVPRAQRDTPVFEILAESGRFLGGMNFAFALCNLSLLLLPNLFPDAQQRAFLLFFFAVTHGSQFAFNVPVAMENRRGGGVWPVLKGTMLFIFVTDLLMTLVNAGIGIAYLL
ncbi:hypothetical protein [Acanthopleuribacter pedis]|uniref:Uncharacterized protein n=1 Tax=Acanthopleuribacter pedis TaxID=442870 RepID=A0A8J7QGA9_9BACT|nr:hypothetical protein [Acanthopleuribacter pedis]MBO1318098.1 hypothetical protein [Acanthopleuribacter pedis]